MAIEASEKGPHINKRMAFFLRHSSDEVCVFTGLNFFFLFRMFLSFLLNEFLELEIMQKLRLVQDITDIVVIADE